MMYYLFAHDSPLYLWYLQIKILSRLAVIDLGAAESISHDIVGDINVILGCAKAMEASQ